MMGGINNYRRKGVQPMFPWTPATDMSKVAVSLAAQDSGSPKSGDMIAVSVKNPNHQWLINANYHAENFEICESPLPDKEKMLKVLKMVKQDVKDDAHGFEGQFFNGENVGNYFGNHGEAIVAVAEIVQKLVEDS
jgi:hypothetical protein